MICHPCRKTDIGSYVATTEETKSHGFAETFVHIVPTNIFQAMTEGNMLAIIFLLCVFLAWGGSCDWRKKGKPVFKVFFEGTADAMFFVTNQIMKFAPFGVFALIGVTVSKFGVQSLIPLSKLTILVYATMIFFVICILGIIARWAGINIFQFIKLLKR
ncbi:hypothetical protein GCM10020331_025420 [Ectobacillus funiculus]